MNVLTLRLQCLHPFRISDHQKEPDLCEPTRPHTAPLQPPSSFLLTESLCAFRADRRRRQPTAAHLNTDANETFAITKS